MLSAREADLDARIFRLLLEDVRSEVFEDDDQDKRIEIGDIDACMKAGSFFPIYDRETELVACMSATVVRERPALHVQQFEETAREIDDEEQRRARRDGGKVASTSSASRKRS
jgi:hypothetical protein